MQKWPCRYSSKHFMPKGCPRKPYVEISSDGERIVHEDGCPWWIARDVEVTLKDGATRIERMAQCLDFWEHDDRQFVCRRLNGLQTVNEELRNGMLQRTSGGRTCPKDSPAALALVQALHELAVADTSRKVADAIPVLDQGH